VNLCGMTSTGDLANANFPMDSEGHVYHVGLKKGELANRIIIVGDKSRATIVSKHFDNPDKTWTFESSRNFVTFTGKYKGLPVSVVSIGMGTSMVDFFVREARAIVTGPLAIIRLGTCGTPKPDVSVGSIAVATDCVMCYQNFDAFFDEPKSSALDYYHLTKPLPTDVELTQLLTEALKVAVPEKAIVPCTDVSTDSFYCSQGRIDPSFEDNNTSLIDEIVQKYPNVGSFQMETYQLCHLARISRGSIYGAAACIILAQRRSGAFLTHDEKHALENSCGSAVLEAVTKWHPKNGEVVLDDSICVWNK